MGAMPTMHDDTTLGAVRLVASDMDYTLLADDGSMPPEMPRRIRELEQVGSLFVAASGRPMYTLKDQFADDIAHMGFISDNGALIAYHDQVIFKSLIEPAAYHEIIRYSGELADGGIIVLCALDGAYVSAEGRVCDDYLSQFFKNIVYVENWDGVEPESNKCSIYYPDHSAEGEPVARFSERFGESYFVTTAGDMWVDVMNKGVDKGSGVSRLCAHLGIDLADALTLGDNFNDIQMLEAAGHGYVVANAADVIKGHANFEAPSNNERGVAQVIDRIVELRR